MIHERLTSNESYSFNEDWRNTLESLLAYGVSSGADLVEIFVENTNNINLLAEQDLITTVTPTFSRGADIRVFKDNRDGFVSTNDLTENGLKESLKQGLAMLSLDDNQNCINPFEGLNQLRDYADSKGLWLTNSPSIKEASSWQSTFPR